MTVLPDGFALAIFLSHWFKERRSFWKGGRPSVRRGDRAALLGLITSQGVSLIRFIALLGV